MGGITIKRPLIVVPPDTFNAEMRRETCGLWRQLSRAPIPSHRVPSRRTRSVGLGSGGQRLRSCFRRKRRSIRRVCLQNQPARIAHPGGGLDGRERPVAALVVGIRWGTQVHKTGPATPADAEPPLTALVAVTYAVGLVAARAVGTRYTGPRSGVAAPAVRKNETGGSSAI